MLNQVVIMGRLVRDPELRRTQSGVAVTSFALAVERDFKGNDGEKTTDFIDCVAWRNTAEFICRNFTKGQMGVVSGRLQINERTDKDGNKRRTAEVVAENIYFASSKPREDTVINKADEAPPANDPLDALKSQYPDAVTTFEEIDDDEALPF